MTSTVYADEPMPYDEYQALIARARAEAQAARSQSPAECEATMARLAAELEVVKVVQMPDGTIMPVDNCGLSAALRAKPCNAARVESSLRGMDTGPGSSSPQPGGQPSPSAGSDSGGGGLPDPMGFGWLRSLLERLGVLPPSGRTKTPATGGQPETKPTPSSSPAQPDATAQAGSGQVEKRPSEALENLLPLVVFMVVIALALLGTGLALELRHRRRGRERAVPPADVVHDTAGAGINQTQKLVEAGKYREAMRVLYLTTLRTLSERGKIRLDSALTNHEVLRRTADDTLASRLAPVVATFEQVWYGIKPLDRAGYEVFAAHVAALEQE